MRNLQSLHNKTQEVTEEGLPYNPNNKVLQEIELRQLFNDHGLEGIQFHNINLYRNAFIHRSYCTMKNADFITGNERCPPDCIPLQEMSYERLEFLGDAILGMVVARYLFERYPDQNEGFLSMMRTKIVNGKMLGSLGQKIGFHKYALISKQIEDAQGRTNYKTMEDIFEAFIAAIYLDFQNDCDTQTMPPSLANLMPLSGAGFHIAETWIVTILEKYLDFAELIQTQTNYKDMLSKYMQNNLQDGPRFFEVNVDKRNQKTNNSSIFTYCVKDKNNAVIGTAKGTSKKDAENNAALVALEYYGQSAT
jgi:ribonuclease-3